MRHMFLLEKDSKNWSCNHVCSSTAGHSFQNRTGPGGRIVKTENRDENRFFKPKEPDFLLIP